MKTYGVIGAGGFGREVMPLVKTMIDGSGCAGEPKQFVFVVEDKYKTGTLNLNRFNVIGMTEFLALSGEKFYSIAIGDSYVRERIAKSLAAENARPLSTFSRTFECLDGNEIGDGAIFANFTHVTSNAKIGKHFHCNIYSYVAHDVVIGDYVTFAPGVKCNGHVVIEDYAYVGAGAIIKDATDNPIRIGKGAVVGMGAVVTKSVKPGEIVVGNPAKPLTKD